MVGQQSALCELAILCILVVENDINRTNYEEERTGVSFVCRPVSPFYSTGRYILGGTVLPGCVRMEVFNSEDTRGE